jgi:hypothetical protein
MRASLSFINSNEDRLTHFEMINKLHKLKPNLINQFKI